MNRWLAAGVVLLLVAPIVAWAQTTTDSTSTQVDSSTSALSGGTPNTWITAARARHSLLVQARVNNPRSGKAAGTLDGITTNATSAASTSGLSSLISQLSSALAGGSGSLSDLSSLISSLTGSTSTTDTTSSTGGTSAASSGSQTSLQDLLNLRDSLLGSSQSSSSSTSKQISTAQPQNNQTVGGAIARLPKLAAQEQTTSDQSTTTTTTDQKFVGRLGTSLATTFFTALTVGFQSTDFINFLKSQLKLYFFPAAKSTSTNGGTGSGSGIEDTTPPSGSGGNSGSIV
jgi:hypothetical protein